MTESKLSFLIYILQIVSILEIVVEQATINLSDFYCSFFTTVLKAEGLVCCFFLHVY